MNSEEKVVKVLKESIGRFIKTGEGDLDVAFAFVDENKDRINRIMEAEYDPEFENYYKTVERLFGGAMSYFSTNPKYISVYLDAIEAISDLGMKGVSYQTARAFYVSDQDVLEEMITNTDKMVNYYNNVANLEDPRFQKLLIHNIGYAVREPQTLDKTFQIFSENIEGFEQLVNEIDDERGSSNAGSEILKFVVGSNNYSGILSRILPKFIEYAKFMNQSGDNTRNIMLHSFSYYMEDFFGKGWLPNSKLRSFNPRRIDGSIELLTEYMNDFNNVVDTFVPSVNRGDLLCRGIASMLHSSRSDLFKELITKTSKFASDLKTEEVKEFAGAHIVQPTFHNADFKMRKLEDYIGTYERRIEPFIDNEKELAKLVGRLGNDHAIVKNCSNKIILQRPNIFGAYLENLNELLGSERISEDHIVLTFAVLDSLLISSGENGENINKFTDEEISHRINGSIQAIKSNLAGYSKLYELFKDSSESDRLGVASVASNLMFWNPALFKDYLDTCNELIDEFGESSENKPRIDSLNRSLLCLPVHSPKDNLADYMRTFKNNAQDISKISAVICDYEQFDVLLERFMAGVIEANKKDVLSEYLIQIEETIKEQKAKEYDIRSQTRKALSEVLI